MPPRLALKSIGAQVWATQLLSRPTIALVPLSFACSSPASFHHKAYHTGRTHARSVQAGIANARSVHTYGVHPAHSVHPTHSVRSIRPGVFARHAISKRALATTSDAGPHHPRGPDGKSRARPESATDHLHRLEAEARAREAARDMNREHVGPFPLGVGPSGRRKAWKSWSQLGLGGKLVRAVRQSGNLAVILFGAGLFVILGFALSTELFAKNSPSVLYSQCIDMIRDTNALNNFLLPPLAFTHSPSSSTPSRGTTPVAHRMVRHPVSGRDHLLLSFWVHGRGRDEPEPLHWAKKWYLTAEQAVKRGAYAVGLISEPPVEGGATANTSANDANSSGASAGTVEVNEKEQSGPGFLSRIASSLSLRASSSVRSATESARNPPPPGTYKIGEVRADYVKNASGHYTMLSLVVDVPSARASYPGRAIVFWSPEAAQEGLLDRRF